MTSLNSRVFLSLLGVFLFSFSALAQEKTAASLYNEGLALLKSKNYAEGLTLMEQAVTKAEEGGDEKIVGLGKKNGAVAAYNLGNAQRKAGALEEAMALYQKAATMNPSYSSTYEGIGRTLEAQGKKQEALESYLKAAQMSATAGKSDRAAKRYKKAQTMVGKTYVAKDYDAAIAMGQHYYLSKALGEKGDNETAASHISKAIELAGAEAPGKYYYAQGSQLEKLGKNSEAISAYKKITDDKYKANAAHRITALGGE